MEKKNNYVQIKKNFVEKFSKEVIPILKRHEQERLKTKKTSIMATIGIVSFFLIIGVLIFFSDNKIDINIIIAMFVVSAGARLIIKKHFEDKIKEKIMPIICPCFGDLRWESGKSLKNLNKLLKNRNFSKEAIEATIENDVRYDKTEYYKTGITRFYNNISYDDIFVGSHNNINFILKEVHCTHKTGSGKNSSNKTVFNGIFITIDFNKKFNSHTVILPDSIFHNSPFVHLKHTVLEDVVFEKNYDVYTNDEVEARYLITTAFMERLNNIKEVFDAKRTRCAFFEDQLIIGLETKKDTFSICDLNKPLVDSEQFSKMFKEMLSIYQIIDHFKLTQKIGL